jgi:ANTAR domain
MSAQCTSTPVDVPAPDALPDDVVRTPAGEPAVVLVRTARGWSVVPAAGTEPREPLPLVEAMSLADLLAEEAGVTPEPGRPARLAARGNGGPAEQPEAEDPRDAELATLRRTVGQLEHALAARVSIERAIGVLAERHGTAPRAAFERLRGEARSQGRPVAELAREVLESLGCADAGPVPSAPRWSTGGPETSRRSPGGRRPGPEGRS